MHGTSPIGYVYLVQEGNWFKIGTCEDIGVASGSDTKVLSVDYVVEPGSVKDALENAYAEHTDTSHSWFGGTRDNVQAIFRQVVHQCTIGRARAPMLDVDAVIRLYQGYNDVDLVEVLHKQVQDGDLSAKTLSEYHSVLLCLCRALEPARNSVQLPSLAEVFLSEEGPAIITERLPCAVSRNVASVGCSLVSRCFPELEERQRAALQERWRLALRQARKAVDAQAYEMDGYRGNTSRDNLPTWSSMESAILNLGHLGDKIMLLLYTDIPFKPQWSISAPLLNFGAIRIYQGSEAAPTLQQMMSMVSDPAMPQGWLILHPSAASCDRLWLALGTAKNGNIEILEHSMNHRLSCCIREYLITHPGQYLFTDSDAPAKRQNVIAKVNRLLFDLFKVRTRSFRLAIALHKKAAMQQLQRT